MKNILLLFVIILISTSLYAQSRAAKRYYHQGSKEMEKQKFEEALRLLTLSIEANRSSDAYFKRGLTYFETGDSCKACLDLIEAFRYGSKIAAKTYREQCVYRSFSERPLNTHSKPKDNITHVEVITHKCLPDSAVYHLTSSDDGILYLDSDNIEIETTVIHEDILDEIPEFPGGVNMFEFIANNIRYPDDARNKGIQGQVFVSFVVKYDGTVSDIELVRSVHHLLDFEAVRLISIMPRWEPGKRMGWPANFTFIFPIRFTINR